MTAAALVKRARLNAGLTQAELARRASTTQSVIARLEAAGANPRLATLDKVIAATGHSLTLELGSSEGIDETMIASNLRDPPAKRLKHFGQAYRSLAGLADAARKSRGS